MFTVYLDDSGTAPMQRVANATALIIPALQLETLERQWETLKNRESFSCFHTSEFAARNYKSEFAKWDDAKSDRVFGRIRQIIKKFGVRAYSFSVNKKDYDEITPEEFRTYSGKFHYTWAIRHVHKYVLQWRLERNLPPVEFVFDFMKPGDPRRTEIENVMEQAEETNYTFRERCELPGLQCVDVLAWSSYQLALNCFHGTPLRPIAQLGLDDFTNYQNQNWFHPIAVLRKNLEKWVQLEMATGHSMKRFKKWEDERGKKI